MTIRYCSPEWLEESAKRYRSNSDFENALKRVTAKIYFRITAEPTWGIEKDILFCTLIDQGKLLDLSFCSEEDARKNADFILSTSPTGWKGILRKEKKFITEFLGGKVVLEAGSMANLLKITPFANYLVDALTQFDLLYQDEMSPDEISGFRSDLAAFRDTHGV
jgi:hypothetical protein